MPAQHLHAGIWRFTAMQIDHDTIIVLDATLSKTEDLNLQDSESPLQGCNNSFLSLAVSDRSACAGPWVHEADRNCT